MMQFLLFIHRVWKKFSKDEMTVYAAQAAFFTILASIPLLMTLITIIQLIPGLTKNDLEVTITNIIPEMFHTIIFAITDDLFTRSPGTILSITAITTIWSASRSVYGIEKGLNRILGDHVPRRYLVSRLICMGYTFIFVLMCVMALGFWVFGSSIGRLLENYFPHISRIVTMVINFRALITFLSMALFFVSMYTYLPRRKLEMKKQVPGALVSSAGWLIFSFGFSIYFENFSNYSYIYGSLTAVILLMLWLYFCICILFAGAELNCVYVAVKEKNHIADET
ncbi:MAG: YihY/virulence factor BrkB family protein [bacterium]|nr:YihY/virulence factor BrkB family protein [bacterium]